MGIAMWDKVVVVVVEMVGDSDHFEGIETNNNNNINYYRFKATTC